MKINIWSDIRCPFCYIGKRKFEAALDKFPHKDEVEVIWRSFQLDPNLKTRTDISTYDYFAEIKGKSKEEAIQMHQYVNEVAGQVGLRFDFDKAIVANSFNAHRLIQLARTKGLGDDAEELLFKAHFTEGKNIDDNTVLMEIGLALGLGEAVVKEVLETDAFAKEVREDELRAHTIGVRGVPFFVFNDKMAVSGAQSPDIFLDTLNKAWAQYQEEKAKGLTVVHGEACTTEGNCS